MAVDGPWRHRFVAAHGARFHAVLAGPDDPPPAGQPTDLVVLLPGALQNWWLWRDVLPGLAAAGHRAVALDLRGTGASDATPRGYDLTTLAADVDAVVRSLGAERAVVVGHDLGGWVAWTLATTCPARVVGLVAVSSPHPLAVLRRRTGLPRAGTSALLRQALAAQPPSLPERRLLHGDGIRAHLDRGRATPAPAEDVELYRTAVRVPSVAHTSLEPWRWLVRSAGRHDGRAWRRTLGAPVTVPVLIVDGAADPLLPARLRGAAGEQHTHRVDRVQLPGVGHLAPEEDPAGLLAVLLPWLERVSPPRRTPSSPPGPAP